MKIFENYRKEKVFLSVSSLAHIKKIHPEIQMMDIRRTLEDPSEVRRSTRSSESELYYLAKKRQRYICVVVKNCSDGNFISTALTTSKPKLGFLVYRKGD